MSIGNRAIGGHTPVDALRDQVMMFVRRLRAETAVDAQNWTQLSLLAAIDRLGDEASPTALGRDLDARSSNVAAALREAERQGYVKRAVDPHDKRKARLLMTPQGQVALNTARAQRSRWLSSAVAELTEDDRRTLFLAGDLLERLATGSHAPADEP